MAIKENQLFGSLAFLERDNSVLPRRIRGDCLLVVKKRVDDYLCSNFSPQLLCFEQQMSIWGENLSKI